MERKKEDEEEDPLLMAPLVPKHTRIPVPKNPVPKEFQPQESMYTDPDVPDKKVHAKFYHPSRSDIVSQEPPASRLDTGSLDVTELQASVGRYIAQLKLEPPALDKRHEDYNRYNNEPPPNKDGKELLWNPWGPPLPTYDDLNFDVITGIWNIADADNDGTLSISEAKEIIRVFLACVELRQLLGDVLYQHANRVMRYGDQRVRKVWNDIKVEDEDSEELHGEMKLQWLCKHSVSHACLSVAKKIPSITKRFWQHMDVEADQEVVFKEFRYHFQKAAVLEIIPPLWTIVAARIQEVIMTGAWRGQTDEEINGMVKKYKKEIAVKNLTTSQKGKDCCDSAECSFM